MHAFTNAFERRWFWIFMAIWAFICLPLPWFYDTEYNPSFFGVPLFIFGWLAYGLFTIAMIGVWAASCLKRPEYHEFDEDEAASSPAEGKKE